jgi:hypothetical protein
MALETTPTAKSSEVCGDNVGYELVGLPFLVRPRIWLDERGSNWGSISIGLFDLGLMPELSGLCILRRHGCSRRSTQLSALICEARTFGLTSCS